MFVIVGLGNPGSRYENTRHNAGFYFVEHLGEYFGWDTHYDVGDWEIRPGEQFEGLEVKLGGTVRALLIKPLTFMNQSGSAVQQVLSRQAISVTNQLVVAHDDLDIDLGAFKIQNGVSPKRHKGILSVEMTLQRRDFLRVRIGVDNRKGSRKIPPDRYVLTRLNKSEIEKLDEAVAGAVKQLRSFLEL